jgi:hypothetical protein
MCTSDGVRKAKYQIFGVTGIVDTDVPALPVHTGLRPKFFRQRNETSILPTVDTEIETKRA